MARKNLNKFKEYYTGVFSGLQATGTIYFPEHKNSEDKAQAAWDSGYWDISNIKPNLAYELERQGYLNVGICPFCGNHPIGDNSTWDNYWKWHDGPILYICEDCYLQGIQSKQESKTNNKKTINFSVLLIIYGYFLASIIIGINQYLSLGALSTIYIVTQWTILGISLFCTLFFHNNKTGIRDLLAIVGGGLAMMDIIQAVLFYILGDFITTDVSLTKIVLLVVIAIAIMTVVYRHLTKGLRQIGKNSND